MQQNNLSGIKDTLVKELFKIGAHFGFSRTRRHPSTGEYVYGYKNKTAIINLEKSADLLAKAKEFVKGVAAQNKQILFVGNKNEAREIMKKNATEIDMPYVAERWIGGTFTNFKQIRSRVEKMKDYKDKAAKGELSVYTKKERGVIAKEVEKLEKFFDGIVPMDKLPGAVFVIDPNEERIAVDEAKLLNIPVIALSGSDCDIRAISYPIVANDSSITSIEYFTREIKEAYAEGKKVAVPAPAVATA